jgi:glycosyltransferase involved in cell wall biosynthesis
MIRLLFILSNIFDTINGVSTKYIKFIEYLSNISYLGSKIEIILFLPMKSSKNYPFKDVENIELVKISGVQIPYYTEIKIPILSSSKILSHIKTGHEIIVFNGEFFWLYEKLKKIQKKNKDIKIFPNMHTDYAFYMENIYKYTNIIGITPFVNHLDHYLEKKYFEGIIVTGDNLKDKFLKITNNVFNANEINLSIFKEHKIDDYDLSLNNLQIIYCGRISKEKNIDEVLECIIMLEDYNYNYTLNIIGDGPYLSSLQHKIIQDYDEIKDKIIFHGSLGQEDIYRLYSSLKNRIFIFTSESETFGKTPMEAGACGVPIFIKKSDASNRLYIDNENAYIFTSKNDFFEKFKIFLNSSTMEKKVFIENSIANVKKYDQTKIFEAWLNFLIKNNSKIKTFLNFFDIFAFHSVSKFINCSGILIGD